MDVWNGPSAPLPVLVRNADGEDSNAMDFTFTAAEPGATGASQGKTAHAGTTATPMGKPVSPATPTQAKKAE
jgi:hypothetical protein